MTRAETPTAKVGKTLVTILVTASLAAMIFVFASTMQQNSVRNELRVQEFVKVEDSTPTVAPVWVVERLQTAAPNTIIKGDISVSDCID